MLQLLTTYSKEVFIKQTKLLAPLFIGSTLLIFTACGGNSSKEDKPKVETAKNISEAKENYKALGAFSSVGSSMNSISVTNSTKLQKTQSNTCSNGGSATFNYVESSNSVTFTFSSCKEENTLIDGTMIMIQSDDEKHTKMQFKNLTMDDGKTKITSNSLIFEDDSQENWSTIDGDLGVVSKCFSGNFDFETVAKLYEAQDNSENLESGILKLNGATYTFANPYVTIKAGSEERTLLQSELEKEMSSSTSCSE